MAAIRKNTGLDGILSSYQPNIPEEPRKTVLENDWMSRLLEHYRQLLELEEMTDSHLFEHYRQWLELGEKRWNHLRMKPRSPLMWRARVEWFNEAYLNEDYLDDHFTEPLTPFELNLFLQMTLLYEKAENYSRATGYLFNYLMERSYEAGFNDFILDTTNLHHPLHALGALKGVEDNPLQLTINGNVGTLVGCGARYAHIRVYGNAGSDFAYKAEHCRFWLSGNLEPTWNYSSNCLFLTDNKLSYDTLCKHVKAPEHYSVFYQKTKYRFKRNRVIHLKNGKIRKIVRR